MFIKITAILALCLLVAVVECKKNDSNRTKGTEAKLVTNTIDETVEKNKQESENDDPDYDNYVGSADADSDSSYSELYKGSKCMYSEESDCDESDKAFDTCGCDN